MPKKFAIYCDAAGGHLLLLEPRPVGSDPNAGLANLRPHAWLAFHLETRALRMATIQALHRMQYVGHAALA